jgi:hypothetical protein
VAIASSAIMPPIAQSTQGIGRKLHAQRGSRAVCMHDMSEAHNRPKGTTPSAPGARECAGRLRGAMTSATKLSN